MKGPIQREAGEDLRNYVICLMRAKGVTGSDEQPTLKKLRRVDKNRQRKKDFIENWRGPFDPNVMIIEMKDFTAHLAYTAENAVDSESNFIVSTLSAPLLY